MNLSSYRQKVDELLAERNHQLKVMKTEKDRMSSGAKKVADTIEAQKVLQLVAQQVQQEAHRRLTGVVSRCLRAVFGDRAYDFKVEFTKKRGKTEAELTFYRDGKKVDPMEGAGLGQVDVASFALRLSALLLQQPKRRRLLVVDEPFKNVSERKQYRDKVKDMLEQLAEDLSIQIVMVTHDRILEAGKVVELEG